LNIHSLSQAFGKIGEKEARKWLENLDYEVYSFQEIIWKISDLEQAIDRLGRRRKLKYKEQDRIHIRRQAEFLKSIFGGESKEIRTFCREFLLLSREVERIRQAKNFTRRGVGPDFVVKKDNAVTFVEVKVNEADLTKYQKVCFKIAKSHGFRTMVLRVKVEQNLPKDIRLTEF
jgi:Holliday junction resolvase-like predicted endonuclease